MPPEVIRQWFYLGHNKDVIDNFIIRHEKLHNIKVFKYVTYKQMADIFVNGSKKKEDIKKPKKFIFSNDGYLDSLDFADLAIQFSKYRK